MSPGRELDALIAEKMGPVDHPSDFKAATGGDYCAWCDSPLDIREKPFCRPPYSTNIAAAWLVFERLCPRGMSWVSFNPGHFGTDGKKGPAHWTCAFQGGAADSEFPAHAICLAALQILNQGDNYLK